MKTVKIRCPCCGSMVEIYPTHPLYEALKADLDLQRAREVHPEVAEDDQSPDADRHC